MTTSALLEHTASIAAEYLAAVGDVHVGSTTDYETLLRALGGPLPVESADALRVIDDLSVQVRPGLVASPGPRHFGFVIGGVLPSALAADWLASAWDQNAFSFVLSPAATAVEEIVGGWLTDLLGLSPDMSFGIVTGGTMGNFTGLAAARQSLLARAGWDVEERGLFGAPEIPVLTSDESHITIFASLQMLGMGRARVTRVAADEQGRMRPDALQSALSALASAPAPLVCAQVRFSLG